MVQYNTHTNYYFIHWYRNTSSILALGPKNSDVENFLNEGKYGSYFDYNESILIRDEILDVYNGKNKYRTVEDNTFTREKLTVDLIKLLDEI